MRVGMVNLLDDVVQLAEVLRRHLNWPSRKWVAISKYQLNDTTTMGPHPRPRFDEDFSPAEGP